MSPGDRIARLDAGLLYAAFADPNKFTGWTREGYWDEGTLLDGKEGRTVNVTKFSSLKASNASRKPQEAARAIQKIKTAVELIDRRFIPKLVVEPGSDGNIPAFMDIAPE